MTHPHALPALVYALLAALPAAADWTTQPPVARWDVVPLQVVDEPFKAGVVAHHPDGVASVTFDFPGDLPDVRVERPTLNPRTGVVEFWATLDPDALPAEGNYTVTATVASVHGVTRTLALTLNGRDTVEPVVELGAGHHHLTDLPRTEDRWIVVRPAPGVAPEQVTVDVRFRALSPIRLEHLHLRDVNGGLNAPMVWLHHVDYTAGDGGEGRKWTIPTIHWTDSHVHDLGSAMLGGTGITRNCTASNIWADAIERPGLVLNTTVQMDRYGGPNGGARHPDGVSTWRGLDGGNHADNIILQNLTVEDSPTAQGITVSPNADGVLRHIALIDCTVRNTGASYLTGHLEYVFLQRCRFNRAAFQLRPEYGIEASSDIVLDTVHPLPTNARRYRFIDIRYTPVGESDDQPDEQPDVDENDADADDPSEPDTDEPTASRAELTARAAAAEGRAAAWRLVATDEDPVYDATPQRALRGMPRMDVIYEHEPWPRGTAAPRWTTPLDLSRVQGVADRAADAALVMIDLEYATGSSPWTGPMQPQAAQAARGRYIELIRALRVMGIARPIAGYGIGVPGYAARLGDRREQAEAYALEQAPIVDELDVLVLVAYTRYETQPDHAAAFDAWAARQQARLDFCREHWPEHPVCVLLWGAYHNASSIAEGRNDVPVPWFDRQLEWATEHADLVAVWAHPDTPTTEPAPAPWLRAILDRDAPTP